MMSLRATIIYGPSASGKSTEARKYVEKGYTEVNRDNIRFSVIDPGGNWTTYHFNKKNEKEVTRIWFEQLRNAAFEGENVVISDTLLSESKRNIVVDELLDLGYQISVIFLHAPLEELIRRDAARGVFSVGENVIKNQWRTLYENT